MAKSRKEDSYFIEKRELGELFDSKYDLNINLYRGLKPNSSRNALYPILKSFLLSNGRVRKEDIRTYQKGGTLWVDCKSGGISLFDRYGVPVKSWRYLLLKAGTKIPLGLVITKDDYKKNFNATHYTIRPNWDMPLSKFCMLLDELARGLRSL